MLDLTWLNAMALTGSAVFFIVWLILRPRKGGPDAPPMVLSSPISKVPYLGMAIEFGKSPVKMVRRCFDDYGPVFTVPVRRNSTNAH